MNDCDKKASNGKITEKGLIDISKNVVSLVNDGKEIKEDTFRYYFFIEMLKHFGGGETQLLMNLKYPMN